MKKFLQNLNAVLVALGWVKKAKDGELTDEDWAKIASKYKEQFQSDFYDDQKAYEEQVEKAQAHDSVLALLAEETEETDETEETEETDETEETEETAETKKPKAKKVDLVAAVSALISQNKQMVTSLRAVAAGRETDTPPTATIKFDATGIAMPHSDTHLFGVENAIYDRSRRWNQLFMNPGSVHGMGEVDEDVQDQFNGDFRGFAKAVAAGVTALHKAGQLSVDVLRSSANPSLDALTNAGIGDSFTQFRVRELIARVLEIPNPYGIFPLRSGVQDRELITNAFVGELTQAYQDSETSLKGSGSLEPETGYVDDAMILSKFGDFKTMERTYIGYLNTNGSDSVKWGMIEYFLLLYMQKATKERYARVVRGIYLKPVAGTPGHYLNASTGQIPRMFLYNIEKKVRAFVDASLASYDETGTVMIDAIIEFASLLKTELEPLGLEVEDVLAVHVNKNHQMWYKTGYRSKYNLHGDFDGIDVTKVPDTGIPLVWVPNMGNLKVMWATQPGNQQCLENIPGEMFKFYMERRLNNVYVTSKWKEGTSAGYAGKQAASKAALEARGWDEQMIWFPKPYTDLAADATAPDAANGFWFRTIANTGATAITTIANKAVGQMYVIECNSLTNASTIAKAGDFSEITEAWTPTAVGDSIVVVWDAGAAKFKEICRVVGGNLSYNAATTPYAR
ncbi:hypothetical protein [Draconibacterium sp.]|uniref:hypothetical protein n=1 Tax=Draconibacterium sp. TaxID=1965318 RepID=UPI0035666DEF